jgi:hypothetical protein
MTLKKVEKNEALELAASSQIPMNRLSIAALSKSKNDNTVAYSLRVTKPKFNNLSCSLNSEDIEPLAAKSHKAAPLPNFGQ